MRTLEHFFPESKYNQSHVVSLSYKEVIPTAEECKINVIQEQAILHD